MTAAATMNMARSLGDAAMSVVLPISRPNPQTMMLISSLYKKLRLKCGVGDMSPLVPNIGRPFMAILALARRQTLECLQGIWNDVEGLFVDSVDRHLWCAKQTRIIKRADL